MFATDRGLCLALLAASAVAAADPSAAYRTARPSVVLVRCGDSQGTGFVFERAGRVVTAAHVVGCGGDVWITSQGVRHAARVVRVQPQLDLAELASGDGLPAPVLEKSARPVAIGQSVCLVGNAWPGLEPDASGRGLLDDTLSCGRVTNMRGLTVITDAPVNPGESGAPLVDEDGRVVGVTVGRLRGAEGVTRADVVTAVDLLLVEPELRARYRARRPALVGVGWSVGATPDETLHQGPLVEWDQPIVAGLELGAIVGFQWESAPGSSDTAGKYSRDVEVAAQGAWRIRLGAIGGSPIWGRLGIQAGLSLRFPGERFLAIDSHSCPSASGDCLTGHVVEASGAIDPEALLRPFLGVGPSWLELTLRVDALLPSDTVVIGAAVVLKI